MCPSLFQLLWQNSNQYQPKEERASVFKGDRSSSRRPEQEAKALLKVQPQQRPCRNSAHWLVLQSLLRLLSYITQDLLASSGSTHSGLPHWVKKKWPTDMSTNQQVPPPRWLQSAPSWLKASQSGCWSEAAHQNTDDVREVPSKHGSLHSGTICYGPQELSHWGQFSKWQ